MTLLGDSCRSNLHGATAVIRVRAQAGATITALTRRDRSADCFFEIPNHADAVPVLDNKPNIADGDGRRIRDRHDEFAVRIGITTEAQVLARIRFEIQPYRGAKELDLVQTVHD